MFNKAEKKIVAQITQEALKEAINATRRSYEEIWVEALGQVLSIKNPELAAVWDKKSWEFQKDIGERVEYPFEQFLKDIGRIENSICQVLVANGVAQTLN